MKLISYHGTTNLGDAIQTVAMKRFLSSQDIRTFGCVPRELLATQNHHEICCYGWHRNEGEPLPKSALYVSLHTTKAHLEPLDRVHWIGARDSETWKIATLIGFKAILTGCACSTLLMQHVGGAGKMLIDAEGYDNDYTQDIAPGLIWNDQVLAAIERLRLFASAAHILTSRLHVALPCIAMGTPVTLLPCPKGQNPERFSMIENYLPSNRTVTAGDGVREELRRTFEDGFRLLLENYYKEFSYHGRLR